MNQPVPNRSAARRDRGRNPLGGAALVVLATIALGALLAPALAHFAPNAVRIDMVNAAPNETFLLGGDGAGRDIWSRLLYGARVTLLGALIAVSVAAVIGIGFGLIAGYYRGPFDAVASWVSDAIMALPSLVVLLALYPIIGSSIYLAMVVFGVMLSPSFYRLVRNLVLGVNGELYLDAARVSGLSDLRIILRHVLLAIRGAVTIQMAMIAGVAVLTQSGLEFLGLGDPAKPTWGGMLQDAFVNIYMSPLAILWPGLAISLLVAALALVGNMMRDRMQRAGAPSAEPAPAPEAVPARPAVPDEGSGDAALLTIEGLTVAYPVADGYRNVVNGVSLQVGRGETLGLVGESGSGKTQTAFSVLGLLSAGGRIRSGSIRFDGTEISGLGEAGLRSLRGRRIAYVPQEPMSNLDPAFRIGSQLTEPMRALLGLSQAEARERALSLLERVGIVDPTRTFNAYPHQISGGMAQRVLIAGAISCEPDLLIADEPTTALDVTVQAEVLDLLRSLQKEYQMAMIMVTHNLGVVADICDRVAVMRGGEVVETRDVRGLFAAPAHEYTRMLLASTLENSTPRRYVPPAGPGATA